MGGIAEVDEVLGILEQEERALSRRRTRVHGQIDFLYSGGYAHVDTVADLKRLRALERDLSGRRRELHEQIAVARRERRRRELRGL